MATSECRRAWHEQAIYLRLSIARHSIMENVLFKISFPAEFHAQSAAEASMILHQKLKEAGKTSDDIEHIKVRTQEAAIRIIDKKGPLANFADRDHAIQYMIAVPRE